MSIEKNCAEWYEKLDRIRDELSRIKEEKGYIDRDDTEIFMLYEREDHIICRIDQIETDKKNSRIMCEEAHRQKDKDKNFILAAKQGDLDKCQIILSTGANINACVNYGTAIGCAAQSGNIELCKFLLARGADINLRTIDGETPLMLAAESGKVAVCELLILYGCYVDVIKVRGYAEKSRNSESKIIDLLEQYGLVHKAYEVSNIYNDIPLVAEESDQNNSGDILSWCNVL